ncbi:hypothetical protein [Pseudonocardia sp. KRD291]|uniref:hypothetical protein n=1 Tax=Pseudonocardia sp. KRD291 TaxID=2792007 RepID=UPI001C49E2CE|nr:hypothetical protein [Pseudonocardia sp. KRD291]MBW0103512.1 hypothetical protein [Pseudonocardia sp. KRD291]
MRVNGINYDAGFVHRGVSTHEHFDPAVVAREMRIIRQDLHCTAVRITGGDPDRLEAAAVCAADAGLQVWFCPFVCDLTAEETLALVADCAGRAERLRAGGADVVFLTGSELSLFVGGFLPGDTFLDRAALLRAPDAARLRECFATLPERFNAFLGRAAALARERFGGPISYASLPFERVDWALFDIVSTDAGYRSTESEDEFRAGIRALTAQGKPVAITEFGCATHVGAARKGGRGTEIVESEGGRVTRLDGDYVRDEREQAGYLREQCDVFDQEGVYAAFVYTFANYHLPHRPDSREDLDMAALGIVTVFEDGRGRTYPDMAWEPKLAFAALADRYRRAAAAGGTG